MDIGCRRYSVDANGVVFPCLDDDEGRLRFGHHSRMTKPHQDTSKHFRNKPLLRNSVSRRILVSVDIVRGFWGG